MSGLCFLKSSEAWYLMQYLGQRYMGALSVLPSKELTFEGQLKPACGSSMDSGATVTRQHSEAQSCLCNVIINHVILRVSQGQPALRRRIVQSVPGV